MNKINKPLLVTGIHRSATSWVGRMLAAGGGLTYANEPLSVSHRQGVLGMDVKHWYTYIIEENEAQYLPAVQDLVKLRYQFIKELRTIQSRKDVLRMGRDFFNFTLGRLRGNQVLFKDPCLILHALVRRPLGFSSGDLHSSPSRVRGQSQAHELALPDRRLAGSAAFNARPFGTLSRRNGISPSG